MLKSKVILMNALLAAIAAGGAYWLSADFRPDGVLALLQTLMQPFMLTPYILGSIFGNAHAPNDAVLSFVLFLQFFVLFTLLSKLIRRKRERT